MMFSRILFATLFALSAFTPLAGQVTAVRFSRLVTMRGAPILDAVVIVEGKRIRAVGQGDGAVPAGAKVLDLRPAVGLPGLIDVHTHMSYYWDRAPRHQPLVAARHVWCANARLSRARECQADT